MDDLIENQNYNLISRILAQLNQQNECVLNAPFRVRNTQIRLICRHFMHTQKYTIFPP